VVAGAWYDVVDFCFGPDEEAPVVSKKVSTLLRNSKVQVAHLRSSLFTTPLGYKAMYKRFLLEGMLIVLQARK
jgi:hypothetical protein